MNYKFNERRSALLSFAEPYRTEFEVDKARIIHSEAFRRLQSKTQVLQVSESDFHWNRLTHSVEVAQIGKGISRFIEYKYPDVLAANQINLDHDLIEAICLAHDIGHPPFGHGGEIALNFMMRDHGGFEGNAQTLRILSRLEKYSEKQGMNLTRRTLLGVLKYPCVFSVLWNTTKERHIPTQFHEVDQNEWKTAKCYYDEEQDIVDWILIEFKHQDQKSFIAYNSQLEENHRSNTNRLIVALWN